MTAESSIVRSKGRCKGDGEAQDGSLIRCMSVVSLCVDSDRARKWKGAVEPRKMHCRRIAHSAGESEKVEAAGKGRGEEPRRSQGRWLLAGTWRPPAIASLRSPPVLP